MRRAHGGVWRSLREPAARAGLPPQEKTGAKIDTTGEIFTITGPPASVAQAEQAVRELVEKGYCAMQYEDFSENFVTVHPCYFPDLIGKGGIIIREIKDKLGVEAPQLGYAAAAH